MNGPDKDLLRRLHESLPSMIGEVEKKNAFRQTIPTAKTTPRKACLICGKLFDYGIVQGAPMPELGQCDRCEKLLKDGYIAFISGDAFAFCKSESMKDLAGTVVELNPEIFKRLHEQYNLEWNTKESGNGKEPA